MLQSIIVYTLTGLILFALGRNLALRDARMQRIYHHSTSFWSPEIWLSILTFAIVAGLRYNVGVDHLSYLESYKEMCYFGEISRTTAEQGYIFILKLFSFFDLHFFWYFAFLAFIQLFFVYSAFRHKKFLIPYIGLFIMLGPYFLDWMNGIRQCIAMCVFVYSIELIQKRKMFLYIITILLASFMHRSAVILLPFYFIFYKSHASAFNNKFYLLILFICVFLGNTPTWITFITNLNSIFIFLGYERYVDNFDSVFSNLSEFNWGPRRISVFIIDLIILYRLPQIFIFYKKDKNLPIYFYLFFIGTCLYNLLANTSLEFLRPVSYFTIFRLPISAYTAYYLKTQKQPILFLLFMVLVCSYSYFSIYSTSDPHNTIWYKFFFDY